MRKKICIFLLMLLIILPVSACEKKQDISEEEARKIIVAAGRSFLSEEIDVFVDSKYLSKYNETDGSTNMFSNEIVGKVSYDLQNPTVYYYHKEVEDFDSYGNPLNAEIAEIWAGRGSNNKLLELREDSENNIKSREMIETDREEIYSWIHTIKTYGLIRIIETISDNETFSEPVNFHITGTLKKKKKIEIYEIHINYEENIDNEIYYQSYDFIIENGKLISIKGIWEVYDGLVKVSESNMEIKYTYGDQNLQLPDYKLYLD